MNSYLMRQIPVELGQIEYVQDAVGEVLIMYVAFWLDEPPQVSSTKNILYVLRLVSILIIIMICVYKI